MNLASQSSALQRSVPNMMRFALFFALTGGLALEAPAETVVSGTPAVAQRQAVVNFTDLAQRSARAPAGTAPLRAAQPRPKRRSPAGSTLAADSARLAPIDAAQGLRLAATTAELAPATIVAEAASVTLPSPPATLGFLAVPDNNTFIPPDTMGAVGPNHVMTTLNTQVRIQDRAGTVISTVTLNEFWASVGHPVAFDPHLTYDALGGRWIFTACANDSSATSAILVGVSATSDPTGNWYLYSTDVDAANLVSADFDSVGYNQHWIVVTANLYRISNDSFDSVGFFVFNKSSLYANGAGTFTKFNSTSTDNAFAVAPAITQDGALDTLYLVEDWDGTAGQLRVSTITGPVGSEQLHIDTARPTTTNRWASSGPDNLAPQQGSVHGVDVGDTRVLTCLYRNGSLWVAQNALLPVNTPKRCAAQWWQLAPAGTIQQFGRVDDPTGSRFYAYPSLAVNASNDVLVGYSRFSANQFASGNYSFRFGTDPANVLRADTVLKAGEGAYYATDTANLNRWGDYSATVVDPVDDLTLWTIQEYAAPPSGGSGSNTGVWSTWWGRIEANPAFGAVFLTHPADGMHYPAHPTVTITAANANTNTTFTKVEFFANGTKIAEADASPFTVTWSNVASGSYDLTARSTDTLGSNAVSGPVTILVGDPSSPLGTWESKLSGPAKGTAYVTLADDFSVSGYGMALGTFGLFTIDGSWSFGQRQKIVGTYAERLDGVPIFTGTFLAKANKGKSFSATITPDVHGKALKLKGKPAVAGPDVSGSWSALVTAAHTTTSETYTFTASDTLLNVFDLTGQGPGGPLAGTLLTTARGALNVSFTNAVPRSLAGKARLPASATLKGTDNLRQRVAVKATRE